MPTPTPPDAAPNPARNSWSSLARFTAWLLLSLLVSIALALTTAHPDALAARLRAANPPVVARINAGRVLLDLRSVLPEQDLALLEVLHGLIETGKP